MNTAYEAGRPKPHIFLPADDSTELPSVYKPDWLPDQVFPLQPLNRQSRVAKVRAAISCKSPLGPPGPRL